jgi:acyl-CoA thioesterase FadM
MKTFTTEYEIYFEDISPSGMVHLEKIAEWMSMGRERFFRATCPDYLWLAEGHVAILTVSMSISATGHSMWSDKIRTDIHTSHVKKISYAVSFDFTNERTNDVIAKGAQKVAFINLSSGEFVPVPDTVLDVVTRYSQ